LETFEGRQVDLKDCSLRQRRGDFYGTFMNTYDALSQGKTQTKSFLFSGIRTPVEWLEYFLNFFSCDYIPFILDRYNYLMI